MQERRQKIVEFVNRLGTVSFAQLRAAFQEVSEMTLRTDLKALDEERRLVRVHGGAKSVEVVVGTDDFLLRRSLRAAPRKGADRAQGARPAAAGYDHLSGLRQHNDRARPSDPG